MGAFSLENFVLNKRNSKILLPVFFLFMLGLAFFYLKADDMTVLGVTSDEKQQKDETSTAVVSSDQTPDSVLKYDTAVAALTEGSQPAWVVEMLKISESSTLSRIDRIEGLIRLLEKYQDNPDILGAVLTQLAVLNPIEVSDRILPFLSHPSDEVKASALSALNNAMIPTDAELNSQVDSQKNTSNRLEISNSVNRLLSEEISDETRMAVISGYATTNPNTKDTDQMLQKLLAQSRDLAVPEASFIASSTLRSDADTQRMLPVLSQITSPQVKQDVVAALLSNLSVDVPITDMLSKESKRQLEIFLLNNPPAISSDPAKQAQLMEFRNVLEKLKS